MFFKILLPVILFVGHCFSAKNTDTETSSIRMDTSSAFLNVAMDLINALRQIHHSAPLQYDENLQRSAYKWALLMHRKAEREKTFKTWFAHPKTEGEAVYINATGSQNDELMATTSVMSWYCEVLNYDFASNCFDAHSAQFTQLIWKDTQRVGIAKVVNTKTGWVAIVARFEPPGNWRYRKSFRKNIFEASTYEPLKRCPKRKHPPHLKKNLPSETYKSPGAPDQPIYTDLQEYDKPTTHRSTGTHKDYATSLEGPEKVHKGFGDQSKRKMAGRSFSKSSVEIMDTTTIPTTTTTVKPKTVSTTIKPTTVLTTMKPTTMKMTIKPTTSTTTKTPTTTPKPKPIPPPAPPRPPPKIVGKSMKFASEI